MSEPTIVCVLGMHRSGTSLVTRVLNLLGLDLGPEEHLMRPSSANPAGHWESRPIKGINDEILLAFGGSWFEPPELTTGWERRPKLAEQRRQARELIDADFSDSELWGFKDPRTCLTLPFWQRIVGPMRYLICLRNPVDVASSLNLRKDEPLPVQQGTELWLTYVHAALAATAGHEREIVFYEDLMADPEPVVARLARFLSPQRSDVIDAETSGAIRVVLNEPLWHHRSAVANVVDTTGLAFHVKALYLALRQFVPSVESVGTEVLDLLGGYAADHGRDLAQLYADRAELEQLRNRSRILDRERDALEQRLSERDAELERMATARAGEQRLRRELEAELKTKREELNRLLEDQSGGPAAVARQALAAAPDRAYDRLVAEVRERAQESIPSGATVLVAAKGDDALLELDGSRGWHFPVAADGRYLGYHPASDTAVIAQLEALRARGADHLLLPATTLWWLDHYLGLRRHLEDRAELLLEDEHCAIYRLGAGDRGRPAGPIATLKRAVAHARVRSGRDPSILDWHTGLGTADQLPELAVFAPPGEEAALPYLDQTVEIVVLDSADPARIREARRVAAEAVIRIDPNAPERAELEWLAGTPEGWGADACVTLVPSGDTSPWDASLTAVAETLGDGFAGELSVVGDSASLGPASDRAAAFGVSVRPIEVRADASLAQRARAAAEAADRRVHVFVTAPAVPLPDWLPSMLSLFSSDRAPGVVATRTLSGVGALEEAGGIVAPDGSRRRRGEGDPNPDRPEYCFVRPVDFCSPPVLATTRELFERLRGFDERRLAPGDPLVDFSLRAGRTGAPVYYQPEARLVRIGDADR